MLKEKNCITVIDQRKKMDQDDRHNHHHGHNDDRYDGGDEDDINISPSLLTGNPVANNNHICSNIMSNNNSSNNTSGSSSSLSSHESNQLNLDEMLSLACRQGKQEMVELLLENGAGLDYKNKVGNTALIEACNQGHADVAKLLLERDASNVDIATDWTSDSALTWACTLGNESIVKLLLERGSDTEHRTKDGCTALMFAALAGHDAIVSLLLEHDAVVNVVSDSNHDSPLTFACWKGHDKVVALLLQYGAHIEHRTKEGFTPLMFAALGGHLAVTGELLRHGAQLNVPSGSNNDIPLTSACWKGHDHIVKLLLDFNSNIEHKTKDGCTPLMLAAREGHFDVAMLLLDSGAEVNVASGSENNTPLTLACWKGHHKVADLLLHYGANMEHRNKTGCTPLMLAAREGYIETVKVQLDKGCKITEPSGSNDDTALTLASWKGHYDVVECLLEYDATNIDHQTKTGCTALMEAAREGHYRVVELLIEHDADIEAPDNYGQNPLFMACWKGQYKVAELLLHYGANRDCRTKSGITPFYQACRDNHVAVVQLLLDFGASCNAPFPNTRDYPLTLAAERGHVDLTMLLLSRGANVDCRTRKGVTPFWIACKEGHTEIAQVLAQHGADAEVVDVRNCSALVIAFRSGQTKIVEWLLQIVSNFPSDVECQKSLTIPNQDSTDEDLLSTRAKCLEMILKAKHAREQDALRNAQILFEEIEAEKNREVVRRKKAAAKRRDKKKKRKEKDGEDCTESLHSLDHEIIDNDNLIMDKRSDSVGMNDDEDLDAMISSGTVDAVDQSSYDIDVEAKERNSAENEDTNSPSESSDENDIEEQEPSNKAATPEINNCISSNDTAETVQKQMELMTIHKVNATNKELNSKNTPRHTINSIIGDCYENVESNRTDYDPRLHESFNIAKLDDINYLNANSSLSVEGTLVHKDNTRFVGQLGTHQKSKLKLNKKHNFSEPNYHHSDERHQPMNMNNIRNVKYGANLHNGIERSDNDIRQKQGRYWNSYQSGHNNGDNIDSSPRNEKDDLQKSNDLLTNITKGNYQTRTSNYRPVENQNVETLYSPWQEVNSSPRFLQLLVANNVIGRVIGRAGSKINQITDESGAIISIAKAQPRNTQRMITIKGTFEAIQKAKALIIDAVKGQDNRPGSIENVRETVQIHRSLLPKNNVSNQGSDYTGDFDSSILSSGGPSISSSEAVSVGSMSTNRSLGENKSVDAMLLSEGMMPSHCAIEQSILTHATAIDTESRMQNGKWSNQNSSKHGGKLLETLMIGTDVSAVASDDIMSTRALSEPTADSAPSQWPGTDSNRIRQLSYSLWGDTDPMSLQEETDSFRNPSYRLSHGNDRGKNNRYATKRNATYNGNESQLSRLGDLSKSGWSVHRSRTFPMTTNYSNKNVDGQWHQQQIISKSSKPSADDRKFQQIEFGSKDMNRSRNRPTDRKITQDPVNNLWQINKKTRDSKPPLHRNFVNNNFRNGMENPQSVHNKVNSGKVDFGNGEIGHRSNAYESNHRGNILYRNLYKENPRRPTSLPVYPPTEQDVKAVELPATFPKSNGSLSNSVQNSATPLNLSAYNRQIHWQSTGTPTNLVNNPDINIPKSVNADNKTPNSMRWSDYTPEADLSNTNYSTYGLWNKSNDIKSMKRLSLDSNIPPNESSHGYSMSAMPYSLGEATSHFNFEKNESDNFSSRRQHLAVRSDEPSMLLNQADDVLLFLRQLSLEGYWEIFKKNNVRLPRLITMRESEIQSLGISEGHSKRLAEALKQIRLQHLHGNQSFLANRSPSGNSIQNYLTN
ncbi:Ankyrin repeat domain-containing protein 17 [Trichoplax sp. H2]|nr:Ankyrin repeat domain-containing protein 17 [Trichoplax sp. H2]|eukprot:RDD41757.1 Ankyrin repeat domain-containing protein 17 [Trichoplax sp. H2]